jgi:phage terminase small subunit
MSTAVSNPRRQRFISEYLIDYNATQAAIRAGYSEKTARAKGSHLLTLVDIQAEIASSLQVLQEKASKKLEVSFDRTLEEYMRIAFGDITGVMSWTSNSVTLKASSELPPEVTAMISEVSETINKDGIRTVKIKLHSKPVALEGIRKMMGYDAPVKADVNHTADNSLKELAAFTLEQLREMHQLALAQGGAGVITLQGQEYTLSPAKALPEADEPNP